MLCLVVLPNIASMLAAMFNLFVDCDFIEDRRDLYYLVLSSVVDVVMVLLVIVTAVVALLL